MTDAPYNQCPVCLRTHGTHHFDCPVSAGGIPLPPPDFFEAADAILARASRLPPSGSEEPTVTAAAGSPGGVHHGEAELGVGPGSDLGDCPFQGPCTGYPCGWCIRNGLVSDRSGGEGGLPASSTPPPPDGSLAVCPACDTNFASHPRPPYRWWCSRCDYTWDVRDPGSPGSRVPPCTDKSPPKALPPDGGLVAAASAAGIRSTPGALQVALDRCAELERRVEALTAAFTALQDKTAAELNTLAGCGFAVEGRVVELEERYEALRRAAADGSVVDALAARVDALTQSIRATGARVSAAQDDAEVIALRERMRVVSHLLRVADEVGLEHGQAWAEAARCIAAGEHLKGGE